MSAWTLDVKDPREWEGWRTVEEKPSADAAKSYARWHWFVGKQGIPSHRIFDPLGRLVFWSEGVGNERRMRWRWGNFETREQLASTESEG